MRQPFSQEKPLCEKDVIDCRDTAYCPVDLRRHRHNALAHSRGETVTVNGNCQLRWSCRFGRLTLRFRRHRWTWLGNWRGLYRGFWLDRRRRGRRFVRTYLRPALRWLFRTGLRRDNRSTLGKRSACREYAHSHGCSRLETDSFQGSRYLFVAAGKVTKIAAQHL